MMSVLEEISQTLIKFIGQKIKNKKIWKKLLLKQNGAPS